LMTEKIDKHNDYLSNLPKLEATEHQSK